MQVEAKNISLPTAALQGAVCCGCFQAPAEGKRLDACGRCSLARYCGVACQKAHWPAHKHDCKHIADHLKGNIIRTVAKYPSTATLMTMRWQEVRGPRGKSSLPSVVGTVGT